MSKQQSKYKGIVQIFPFDHSDIRKQERERHPSTHSAAEPVCPYWMYDTKPATAGYHCHARMGNEGNLTITNISKRVEAREEQIRREERERILLIILNIMEHNLGGGIHTGWILAEPLFHKVESLRGGSE